MSDLSIRVVRSKADRDRFIRFLWTVNKDYPKWVPPLWMDRRKLMDTAKNPFYKHSDAEFFLAERDGRVVGRIGAIVNHNHIKEHNEKVGFFGFFESLNDATVSKALFDAAAAFLKSKGMEAMRGPANPSVNDEYGLLVDGFQHSPMLLMPYNPPYYADLIEQYGFKKEKNLYAFYLHYSKFLTEKMERVNAALRERGQINIRPLNMKKFDSELELVKKIYNTAWQKNWGEVPLTDEEIDALAADLKPVVEPELVLFAEYKGETIGFGISLLDINQVLIHNRKGRLIPGLIRLLLMKKRIDQVRVMVLGVLPEYVKTGAASMLFYETAARAKKLGITQGEASWVLEDNGPMMRAAQAMQGEPFKTYRIYQIPLA